MPIEKTVLRRMRPRVRRIQQPTVRFFVMEEPEEELNKNLINIGWLKTCIGGDSRFVPYHK